MTRERTVLIGKTCVITGVIPFLIWAFEGGPDPRKTGAPGDSTCAETGCHVGTAVNGGPGNVTIEFPGGLSYVPGVKQQWTVRVTDSGARNFGFQATSRPASSERNGQAGSFRPTDASTLVLCEDGSQKREGTPCRATAPLEFIEHRMPNTTGVFTFEWTPPDSNIGNVRVWVAGNGANGNGQNTGDRIYTANFTLTPTVAGPPPQIRSEQPVLQAFSDRAGLSSGTWLQIFGTNMAPSTREWAGSDFTGNRAPTQLEGVGVNINGKPAFVRFISPTQINVQAPDDEATGPVLVEVTGPGGVRSNTVTVQKTRVSPALLTTPAFNVGGRQYIAALHTDFRTFVGRENLIAGVPFRPARPGETIILFAVGCGSTNPASPAGQFFPEARPLALPFQVRFGNTVAQATGALAAQAVGLCQFNVTVPNIDNGDSPIDATVDSTPTGQTLFTTIQR